MKIQARISAWASRVFGPVKNHERAVARANTEMAELVDVITEQPKDLQKIGKEMADVVITLYKAADAMGIDLDREVEEKHAVNEARKWHRDGAGNGMSCKGSGCGWCHQGKLVYQ